MKGQESLHEVVVLIIKIVVYKICNLKAQCFLFPFVVFNLIYKMPFLPFYILAACLPKIQFTVLKHG